MTNEQASLPCTIGRTMFRSDGLAGLDWYTPCPQPATYPQGVADKDTGEKFEFCHRHGPHVLSALGHKLPEEN
jgi:hypothetical protein